MDEMELIAFEIISNVGMAKSLSIEALRDARAGEYSVAEQKLDEAKQCLVQGHHAHAKLIQKEASGEKVQISLILMHAEDQLMSSETIKDLAIEIIAMHKDLKGAK